MRKKPAKPVPWFGGKHELVKRILSLVPEHKTYVEVFAGGASLFFAKEKSKVEVLNDLNSGLVNFYRVLRDPERFERFHRLVQLTPYSRKEFYSLKRVCEESDDVVERAAAWFCVARQSFSGVFGSSWGKEISNSARGMSAAVSSYLSAIGSLPEFHERLITVQVEELDFRNVISTYDRPETFFYLDPPYISDTRRSKKVYEHEMTNEDHEDLVEQLLRIKGKAMLSGYDHPIYGPLECAGWRKHDFEVKCKCAAKALSKTFFRQCTILAHS